VVLGDLPPRVIFEASALQTSKSKLHGAATLQIEGKISIWSTNMTLFKMKHDFEHQASTKAATLLDG
jgi:hypothetical protein